jgi:putative oxidoreductase
VSVPFLAYGLASPDLAAAICRLGVGVFFAISGFHKLCSPTRRLTLQETFKADGVYHPALMYVIPLAEFSGGLGVTVGCLSTVAAAGLILLCLGACTVDGLKRISEMKPLNLADWLDCFLYLPEVLYILILAVVICLGPGRWSVDAYFFR